MCAAVLSQKQGEVDFVSSELGRLRGELTSRNQDLVRLAENILKGWHQCLWIKTVQNYASLKVRISTLFYKQFAIFSSYS